MCCISAKTGGMPSGTPVRLPATRPALPTRRAFSTARRSGTGTAAVRSRRARSVLLTAGGRGRKKSLPNERGNTVTRNKEDVAGGGTGHGRAGWWWRDPDPACRVDAAMLLARCAGPSPQEPGSFIATDMSSKSCSFAASCWTSPAILFSDDEVLEATTAAPSGGR